MDREDPSDAEDEHGVGLGTTLLPAPSPRHAERTDGAADRDGVGDEEPEAERIPWWWPTAEYPGREAADRWVSGAFSALAVLGCGLYVLWVLHPDLVFRNTTPTGGDMGAHVWGPAYLRDYLLPNLKIAGWTPDWYSGFPAYTFYMVVPSLFIVALDVGFLPWWTFPVAAAAAIAAAWRLRPRFSGHLARTLLYAALVLVTVLSVDIPYNIAFKVVTIAGLVTFPAGAWWLGKGLGLRQPGPELMAIASVMFLMDKTIFHIYGGNIASTMAGEFAFSISITAALFFLGTFARYLRDGRHGGWAIALFALCGLSHIIPFFFACVGAVVLFLLRPGLRTAVRSAVVAVAGSALVLIWLLPFLGNSTFMNDMGWEKLGERFNASGQKVDNLEEYLRYLLPFAPHKLKTGVFEDPNMLHGRVIFALAAVGALLSIVLVVRTGIFLTAMTAVSALAFWLMPQWRFWNARVLPFYYLSIYLLAAVGVWLVMRAIRLMIAGRWVDPPAWVGRTVMGVVAVVVFVAMQISILSMPFGARTVAPDGSSRYEWPGDLPIFSTKYSGPVRDWAKWNYEGLQGKGESWTEFKGLVDEMSRVGREVGCGRSLWEYDGELLNRYGTPMAPMLLPYFTKGCIGSQEGLYFEASATTPYHFLMQDELSAKCSCAQRFDIFGIQPTPYKGLNLDLGIKHLQMLGVRYYLAVSERAKSAAAADSRLRQVGSSGPWVVYQVADSPLVRALTSEPAVWRNVKDPIHSWAKPSTEWFLDERQWGVLRASSGPRSWQRVKAGEQPEVRPVPMAQVSGVRVGRDSLSFDVDRTGTPVLVKISYFPSWRVTGAKGPYRVAPNLMVVVPTSKQVTLQAGRARFELLGAGVGLAGLALLLLVIAKGDPARWARLGPPKRPPREFIGDRTPGSAG